MKSSLAKWLLRVWGWKILGTYPNAEPKNILVVVPHTSWVDFPLGILVRNARNMDTHFLGKASLFKGLKGKIFRWLGGYPVTRKGNQKMVDAIIDVFNEHKVFDIAIAPEGTRKKVDHLKSGFYWIAKGAGAAIVLVTFDYAKKEVTFSAPFYPSGNADKEISRIENHFRGIRGKVKEYSF